MKYISTTMAPSMKDILNTESLRDVLEDFCKHGVLLTGVGDDAAHVYVATVLGVDDHLEEIQGYILCITIIPPAPLPL